MARAWIPLATAAIIGWPSIVLANEDDGFSPHLFLVVDESGSMKGRHGWLEEALPALDAALDDRNVNALPDQVYFTLAGFTTHGRELAKHASGLEAARAVSALRTGGGTEDGYVAIRDVLSGYLTGTDYAPTTVILVTDEDRDMTDRDLTLAGLSDQLIMNGIVVHAVIRARIECPDAKTGLAADPNGVAIMASQGDFSTCSDAKIRTFDDYAELAWATGGLVWNLDEIALGRLGTSKPETLQLFADVLSDRFIAQWPTGMLWTDISYWPESPRAGDVVTFDAGNSSNNEWGARIVDWKWDLDADGTIDQSGPIIANIFSKPGRHRVVLNVADDSDPPRTGRKVLILQVSD